MTQLFVYYRVHPGHEALAEPLARRVLAEVGAARGIATRLLRRPGARSPGPETWLEIYEPGDESVAQAAALRAEEVGLSTHTEARHTELFLEF